MVAEVGLSIVLLTGAALLLRSFDRLTSVDPGFKPDHVLAFQVSLPRATYPKEAQSAALYSSLVEHLEKARGIVFLVSAEDTVSPLHRRILRVSSLFPGSGDTT